MLARKMVMAQAYLQLVLLEFLCQINVMLMKTYSTSILNTRTTFTLT